MSLTNRSRSDAAKGVAPDFDAIVIGAGFGGGAGTYFDRCRDVADRDFEGFAAA